MNDEYAEKMMASLNRLNDSIKKTINNLKKYNNVYEDPMYDSVVFEGKETTYLDLKKQVCHNMFLEKANKLLNEEI